MEEGRVLWFNENKGFGLIGHDDGREIYVHYTSIAERGVNKALHPGDTVIFDVLETGMGWEASNVKMQMDSFA